MIPVLVVGLSSSDAAGQYSVILQELVGKKRLTVPVTPFEAKAIALHLEGVTVPRPQTHDLLRQMIDGFGAKLSKVVIHDVRDRVYYSRVALHAPAGPLDLDAQPGDAIALALRAHVSIFVDEHVLQSAGTTSLSDAHPLSRQKQIAELQLQLQQAIDTENYEDAARLRDTLERLQ